MTTKSKRQWSALRRGFEGKAHPIFLNDIGQDHRQKCLGSDDRCTLLGYGAIIKN